MDLNADGYIEDEQGNEWGYCNSCGEEARAYTECCDDGEVVPYDNVTTPHPTGPEARDTNEMATETTAPAVRVWWIPQVPGDPFMVAVESVEEGRKICGILADYDAFQFETKVKADHANTGGVEIFENGEWVDAPDEQ